MSLYGSRAEHALHCLLLINRASEKEAISSRDMAEFLGLSLSFVRKLMTDLERGKIVTSRRGRHGGFVLSRAAENVSVSDVLAVIEPNKQIFSCQEIRQKCVLFEDQVPPWVRSKRCEISAVFQNAEQAMRAQLESTTLADIGNAFTKKVPAKFKQQSIEWFERRR